MKQIKINFMDFGKNFNPENTFFTQLLRQKYDVVIADKPDYIFYAQGGQTHHYFDGIRIFWTGENIIPDFNHCDYALGFHHIQFEDRYMRYPLWAAKKKLIAQIQQERSITPELAKRPFCATVISNSQQSDGVRTQFFELLNTYKPVASGGRWNNTVGGPVPDKIAFQEQYKFTMAFENTLAPGYATEKILDAFASNSVPIYYGDPTVVQDFNPKAFINLHDFESQEAALEYIKKVDADDTLYMQMLNEPVFLPGTLEKYDDNALLKFFSNIFDQPYEKARRRFYRKPYQDIDVAHLKNRDFKAVVVGFIKSKFFKKK